MAKQDNETEAQISELSMMEQAFQNLSMQKQNFQVQLAEVESALEELSTTEKAYKIIGSIMIAADKEALRSELSSKKEILAIRVKTLEKQENDFRQKTSELQKKVIEKLGKSQQ